MDNDNALYLEPLRFSPYGGDLPTGTPLSVDPDGPFADLQNSAESNDWLSRSQDTYGTQTDAGDPKEVGVGRPTNQRELVVHSNVPRAAVAVAFQEPERKKPQGKARRAQAVDPDPELDDLHNPLSNTVRSSIGPIVMTANARQYPRSYGGRFI